jgi:hypothetical protein
MEDRLRRRAMQSQRRLEAKRKRLERRNSMNSGRPVPAAGGGAAGRDEGLEHTVPSGFQLRRTVAALTTAGSPTPSRPQQGDNLHCFIALIHSIHFLVLVASSLFLTVHEQILLGWVGFRDEVGDSGAERSRCTLWFGCCIF